MSLKTRLVFVEGLRVEAAIGIYDYEHGRTQPLIIDAEVTLGLHPITGLKDTFNYELFGLRAKEIISAGHIKLVETFAEDLAQAILDEAGVKRVHIRVSKPEALNDADKAGCAVTFEKDQ